MHESETSDRNSGIQEEPEDLDAAAELLGQIGQATEEGRSEDTLSLMSDFLVKVAEWAENQSPNPHIIVREEAHDREAAADWAGAERAYRRALNIAGDNPHWLWKGHDELRRLYMLLGRAQEALEEARAAASAGRQPMDPLHPLALVAQARIHLQLGQAQEARDLATEALPLFGTSAMSDWQRAGALAVRARCHVKLEDEAAAQADLDDSWALLEPDFPMASLPGVQGAIGDWWRAEAAFRQRQGDVNGCVKAWREVVLSRRWNAGQPQLERPYVQAALADALDSLAQAQEMAGDPTAAAECIAESQAIRQEIGQPRPAE